MPSQVFIYHENETVGCSSQGLKSVLDVGVGEITIPRTAAELNRTIQTKTEMLFHRVKDKALIFQ